MGWRRGFQGGLAGGGGRASPQTRLPRVPSLPVPRLFSSVTLFASSSLANRCTACSGSAQLWGSTNVRRVGTLTGNEEKEMGVRKRASAVGAVGGSWGGYARTEHQRIDAFELWCWRRLLRGPWTARRSNQSILKEISPEYSLEGLMLKLKLQYFGHMMQKTDSLKDPDTRKD